MEAMIQPTMTVFKGYTHAAISLLQSTPCAAEVSRYIRQALVEKEYIPEHNEFINGRWRKVWGHWQDKYRYYRYDQKAQKLYVPIAFADDICEIARQNGVEPVVRPINPYPLRKMNVTMNPKFQDRPKQVEPIQKCSNAGPGMMGIELQTGVGKTYCAVKIAVNLGYPTIIIVPGLVDQWIKDIDEYTSARKKNEIYKIEGFQTLALLAQNPQYKPDFFVASTRTMQLFSKGKEGYDVLPWNYKGFLAVYGIGTKIIDECHKQFNATTLMDLKSNVPHNLYLSATFDQTSRSAREIFQKIFPKEIRVGNEVYDRYVTVYFYYFSGQVAEKKCSRAKGYIHALYEVDLMRTNTKFNYHVDSMILPMINQYYINRYQPGHKCLIFCSTIAFADKLVTKLRTTYPDLRVNAYTGDANRNTLENSDIAVATVGKASTGLDWKGLRCCINTVSVKSSVLTSQMLGRLRKINGETLIYVDMCDTNLQAQMRHAENRRCDLERMAASMQTYNGLNDLSI